MKIVPSVPRPWLAMMIMQAPISLASALSSAPGGRGETITFGRTLTPQKCFGMKSFNFIDVASSAFFRNSSICGTGAISGYITDGTNQSSITTVRSISADVRCASVQANLKALVDSSEKSVGTMITLVMGN